MSDPIKAFFVEPTDQADRYLRRYRSLAEGEKCTGKFSFHNAETLIGRFAVIKGGPDGRGNHYNASPEASEYAEDPRWPTHCSGCGFEFSPDDQWQVNCETIYLSKDRPDEEFTLKYPRTPGMMWNAWWMSDVWRGQDGRCLIVVTPDAYEWTIDGPCNNCTMPDDRTHKCWCRHGEVPSITVDKSPNPGETTCSAGGGSIQTPGYHGFLRNGIFT